MPRAEKGTPKQIANAMKAKGLQRLRWYCQVCEKQCRDENGFKCHAMSESHLRQMIVVGENAGRHISDYSQQFKAEFLALLSRRWGTKRVKSNTVYQEYIQDKHHIHMNSTRWVTLTEFCKYLGREGIAHVDETEKGWFISWIDNSPKALAKQAAAQKKERSEMNDEDVMRRTLDAQIQKARAMEEKAVTEETQGGGVGGEASTSTRQSSNEEEETKPPPPPPILAEGEKLKLSFKPKASTSSIPLPPSSHQSPTPTDNAATTSSTSSSSPQASTSTTIVASTTTSPAAATLSPSSSFGNKSKSISLSSSNPLKRNVFKSSALKSSSSATSSSVIKPPPPSNPNQQHHQLSSVEQIMKEDLERKRKREEKKEQTWSKGYGQEGLQVNNNKRARVA